MAMGVRRPGFQLLSLTPTRHPMHAEALCLLPDQLGIYLSVYTPCAVISVLIILVFNIYRTHTVDRRTRSKYSLHHAEDTAWVSSSPMDYRGTRLRLDLESDEQHVPSDNEGSIPPAAHPRHRPLSRFSWTFVFRGRRRRLTMPMPRPMPMSFASMAESIRGWRLQRRQKRDRRGVLGGFVRDVRDVAVFPLGLFALTAWWMFTA
jgi:hypothetical protein